MLTTKQVRNIMRKHLTSTYGLYTNKTAGDTTDIRRVKCYMPRNTKEGMSLLSELRASAGVSNVNVTKGEHSWGYGRPGITVRCIIG